MEREREREMYISIYIYILLLLLLLLFFLQERVFVIPLADIHSMRAIPAKKKGKAPAVDIYFGNPSRPKKITINLHQVKAIGNSYNLQ